MDDLRQNDSDLDWPNGFCGEPLPPEIEEWLTSREPGERSRKKLRSEAEEHLEEAQRLLDSLKR